MRHIRKALVALGGTVVVALGSAMLDGALTWKEVIAAVGGSLVVAGGVWKARNGLSDTEIRTFLEKDATRE